MTDQILTPQVATASPVSRSKRAWSPFDPVDFLHRATRHLARLLRRRRDRAHLAELPDYLLEDIGLTRADVPNLPPLRQTLR